LSGGKDRISKERLRAGDWPLIHCVRNQYGENMFETYVTERMTWCNLKKMEKKGGY
jgi:hypothetical protein